MSNASARYHGARASFSSLHHRLQAAKTSSSNPSAKRPSLISSRAPSRATQTPRSSRSLRQRLSRRLKRKSSQEDIFTEIGSDDDDEDDPTLFPPQDQIQPDVPPSAYVRHAGTRGIQASNDIVVFLERKAKPPPLPEKDIGLSCTQVVCLEPSSPTPLLNFPLDLGEADLEKGELRRSATAATSAQAEQYHPQSPHLGHRSPNLAQSPECRQSSLDGSVGQARTAEVVDRSRGRTGSACHSDCCLVGSIVDEAAVEPMAVDLCNLLSCGID